MHKVAPTVHVQTIVSHGTVKLKTPFVSSVRHAWMLGTVPLCIAAMQLVLLLFILMTIGQASDQPCIAALAECCTFEVEGSMYTQYWSCSFGSNFTRAIVSVCTCTCR